jgi:prolyl-tRNA editing enzyme YbaK/EbsC (Cys-tRNA(Pro) deacylase)
MSVDTFKQNLIKYGYDIEIIESSEKTHTAQEAADAHDVPVSNIVKSLLVTDTVSYALVLVPGNKRLDLDHWKENIGWVTIRMASADEVKDITGFSIGGVPPFGHTNRIDTYIDVGFDPKSELLAAAGSANSVFKISISHLSKIVS